MKVKVLYFAGLREQVGTRGEDLEVPSEIKTVAGVRAMLMERGSTWQSAFAQGKSLRVAVNQELAQPTTPVKPGDEIAFFPPVTGG